MRIPIYISKEEDDQGRSEDILALIGQKTARSVTMLTIHPEAIGAYWIDPDDDMDIVVYTSMGTFCCPSSAELIKLLDSIIVN